MYSKTTFPKFETDFKMNPADIIYTCGSCFAQEFYERLSNRKFQLIPHPFGIVFNPLSIAQQFEYHFSKYTFKHSDLVLHNGLYHSLDHHGSYSNRDPEITLQNIIDPFKIANQALKQISFLVLTLGSAHYYQLNEDHRTVANCHKIPASKFTKKQADTDEIIHVLESTFTNLVQLNGNIKIILSISPVRYLKDGFLENARSKASMLLAADYLAAKFSFVSYFPAFEIFMDDLRDYRYVKDDLVHPNKAAVDYIWSYFEEAFLSEESKNLISKLNQFHQLLNHRILNIHSSDFKTYILKLQHELKQLELSYQHIDFTPEKNKINELHH